METLEVRLDNDALLPDNQLTILAPSRRPVRVRIADLPDEYRAALVLRDITGLSYQEVSEALNISLGTVKSRINRARNILKDKLPAQLEEFEQG